MLLKRELRLARLAPPPMATKMAWTRLGDFKPADWAGLLGKNEALNAMY